MTVMEAAVAPQFQSSAPDPWDWVESAVKDYYCPDIAHDDTHIRHLLSDDRLGRGSNLDDGQRPSTCSTGSACWSGAISSRLPGVARSMRRKARIAAEVAFAIPILVIGTAAKAVWVLGVKDHLPRRGGDERDG